jgi:hypothetical protein
MVLVAEGHRLVGALALPRNPRRALQLIQSHPQGNHQQPRQHQARPSQSIGAAFKYLRHECFPVSSSFADRMVRDVFAVTQVEVIFRLWTNNT